MSKIITVDFEGVNYNASYWAEKTKEDFVNEGLKNKTFGQYDASKQRQILGEAYRAIVDKVKGEDAKAEKAEAARTVASKADDKPAVSK